MSEAQYIGSTEEGVQFTFTGSARHGDVCKIEGGALKVWTLRDSNPPIGIAARDIKKGESIWYSPGRNTADIAAVGFEVK